MKAAAVKKEQEIWDVAVIGGGAAGMMAAGQAAAKGARVVLLEKNSSLGKKLLITGGGRCNITNAEPKERVFLSKFNSRGKAADQFLFSPFSRHGVKDSIAFFNTQGLQTKVEGRERVFPITNLSDSVWDVLVKFMKAGKVQVMSNAGVVKIVNKGKHIEYVSLVNDQKIYARSYIFATGGLSRPDTGSTGDGFAWLTELGHTVTSPDPSLVPLTLRDTWVLAIAGVTLPNVTLSLIEDGKKVAKQTGGLLFTHQGISGPAALNLSKEVGERLPYGLVPLSLDLLPDVNLEALDELLLQTIAAGSNKKIRNLLPSLIPSGLIPIILKHARVNEERVSNSLTREERIALGGVLKNLPMTAKGRLGFEKAIIASGGVELSEIDTKTMRSRVVDNLYIVGDLLNIDRPSGGYSLQLCWTTGTVAGQSAAEAANV